MQSLVAQMDNTLYPDHQRNWDDKLFRERVLQVVNSNTHLLDIGAGAGIVAEMNFKGLVGKAVGIDPDPRVKTNPFLDEGHIGFGDKLPFPDQSFDVVTCDNVLEHLDQPLTVFKEVFRVLKPGGKFLFKTPNKFHYMPLISSITPVWFHKLYNRKRGRHETDTFPTRYRANSRRAVKKYAFQAGFVSCEVNLIEGRPEYMRLFAFTYVFGWLYERLVNSVSILAPLRILLVGCAIKST